MKAIDFLQSKIIKGPLEQVSLKHGRDISVKREEMNHPIVQGNKWHKLRYNLQAFAENEHTCIVSFGGAFSNHIYSLAGACYLLEIPCTIYIRGHEIDENNPTIRQLIKWGTHIETLDYTSYRRKAQPAFLSELRTRHPGAMIIPEGGSNDLGFKGSLSFAEELRTELEGKCDFLCVAAGTGATAAALCEIFEDSNTHLLVFSSLKGLDFRNEFSLKYNVTSENWTQIDQYNFNGYGKVNQDLVDYIMKFYHESGILLEPIYTAKMFFGISDLIKKDFFPLDSEICAIHSGGLQGIKGFNYRFGDKFGLLPTE